MRSFVAKYSFVVIMHFLGGTFGQNLVDWAEGAVWVEAAEGA